MNKPINFRKSLMYVLEILDIHEKEFTPFEKNCIMEIFNAAVYFAEHIAEKRNCHYLKNKEL